MDRKRFIRQTTLGIAGLAVGKKSMTQPTQLEQVGFNHLPNLEERTMKTVLHRAESRGHANHGWLDTHHTFSFANYYNPERMHFGVLRVLNDDFVQGGRGFSTHPHDNMEIISIPLEGDLEHQDSMGNISIIRKNDVQIMSAGTGVYHSEKNKNLNQPVKFLQIWVFPKQRQITPRYDQKTFSPEARINTWQRIVSPNEPEAVGINQDAWLSLTKLTPGTTLPYRVQQPGNGIYLFILDGQISVNGQMLAKRDGMGLWEVDQIEILAAEEAEVLLMDVPMQL